MQYGMIKQIIIISIRASLNKLFLLKKKRVAKAGGPLESPSVLEWGIGWRPVYFFIILL